MSKHIISISSEYTTSNGRRGVCYTLRGARAASFVPADVDALGWLLASLGLAKKEEKMTWTVELEKHRKHKSWMASCGLKSNGRYLAFDFLRCSWKGGEKVYDVTEHGVYATQERNTRRHITMMLYSTAHTSCVGGCCEAACAGGEAWETCSSS